MQKFLAFTFILLAAVANPINGFDWWNDLRVTWAPLPNLGYNQLPRNTIDAVQAGWVPRSIECSNNGMFNGFRYTNPADTGVALLFDVHGHVGGIQSLVPQWAMNVVGSTFRFDRVPMYQNHTIDSITYYVVTVYFQLPSKLCSTTQDDADINDDGIGPSSLVYFQNGPNPSYLKIAHKARTDAIVEGWTINQCIPGMGQHNFYAVDTWQSSGCDEIQPTCLLYNEQDELFGFCLTYPGNTTVSNRWEHPTSAVLPAILGDVPVCLSNLADRLGFTTLHVYFTNTPWAVGCN